MPLVAWYPLNGDVNDYSGNGRHLTNSGAASLDGEGKIGKCLNLTGNASQKLLYTNFPINKIKFTWSVWIYGNGANPANYAFIVSQGRDNIISGINIATDSSNNNILIFIGDNVSNYSIPISCLNTWRHVTLVGDGINLKTYVDGVLEDTRMQPEDINFTYATDNALLIGKMTYGYTGATTYFPFNGRINDVRIYNHALSDNEIKEIAKTKVLHYTFNDFQEPTENLVQNPLFYSGTNWALATNGTGNFSTEGKWGKITVTDSGSYYYLYQNLTRTTFANQPVTFSVKFKNNSIGTVALRLVMFEGGSAPQQPMTYIELDGTGGEIIASVTAVHTLDSNALRLDILTGSYYSSVTDTSIEFTEAQLEEKDHLTPFTENFRSGEIYDSSGYGNDANLDLATTPQYIDNRVVGSGAYRFLNNQGFESTHKISLYDFTMNCWVKPTALSAEHHFMTLYYP
jgi:hypothetical protein